jgi:hypothetical protein
MFEHEERVIRAARRWTAMCNAVGVTDVERCRILRELEFATEAYEKRLRLRPLKVETLTKGKA